MNWKKLTEIQEKNKRYVSGHRACAGCPFSVIVKTVLAATDKDVVVANATGCLEVVSTIYPYNAWNVPWIHANFGNSAAVISGVETAYKSLKKQGKLKKEIKFIVFGGDGGTYDIGLQALSGAMERRHDFLYVCYDNEGYMNTGGQRSSATPLGANTTTDPAGTKSLGKETFRKNLAEIAVAHKIPYVAQASIADLNDLHEKAKKGFEAKGPALLIVLSPCIPVWKINSDMAFDVSKKAVDSGFWQIYEVENGKYKINYKPNKFVPIENFLKLQGRFNHLFKDSKGKEVIAKIKKNISDNWKELEKKVRC